ncbi:MAG: MmgE/PrpD family protein [Acidobacteriota bacterium]
MVRIEKGFTRREMLYRAGAAFSTSWLGGSALVGAVREDDRESVAKVWADIIAAARYEDLSAEVVRRTKLCILDNIGVIAHTSTLKDSATFLDRPLKIAGPGEATVWGTGAKLPLETATACNAYLIHGNEIDDSDFRSNYRPSCVSLPAPLSVADHKRATGRELILATAIAYSVNGRLAAPLDRLQGLGFMPSSVVGGGGSAAATAKLMKLTAEETLSALTLGIAGGGGLFQYYFDQTEDKKLHVARAARFGVEVAMLAAKGWKGPSHIVEGPSGLLPSYLRGTGRPMDYQAMKRDFGQFEGPLFVYPKFTSCSSSIGPFLDALDPVYKREKIKVADVEKFVVIREWPKEGPFVQKILHFEPPQTIVGAQLNMNFAIALYLHRGSASVYDFTEESLRDKSVLELASRVGYEEVPEQSDYAIRLVLRNGRTVEAPFKYSRGKKPEPEALDRRLEKFASLTRDRLTEAGRKQVIEMVDRLESVRDIAQWTSAINRLFRPLSRVDRAKKRVVS